MKWMFLREIMSNRPKLYQILMVYGDRNFPKQENEGFLRGHRVLG